MPVKVGQKVKVVGTVKNYITSVDSTLNQYISHVQVTMEDEYGNKIPNSEVWIKTTALDFE